MPNWCFTYYAAEGPKEELQKLYDTMIRVAAMPHPGLIKNGFGSSWLGNLVMALGIDPIKQSHFRCRGEYSNVDLGDSCLTFDTMTAWCEADDTRHLIETRFPGVKLYYISEEFGCEYWITNDIQGKYFSERYYFSSDDYTDEDGNYYDTLPELLDAVKEATGLTGMLTFAECDQALQNYQDGNYSYSLYRINYDTQDT